MQPERVVELISKSAARLTDATKTSMRDERWWASLAEEDWNLIKLSWELRGVILRRERPQAIMEESDGGYC